MRFGELIRRIGVEAERTGGDPEVGRICEDSRKVVAGDLFVARGGTKANGARFVAEAVGKGAVAVVSEEAVAVPDGVAVARVENANLAAALLAHELAGNPTRGMKMIGITGTKGKTTVAYLLRSVLKAAGKKVGMIGTVEIDDGKEVVAAEMTTPGAVEMVEMFCRMRANGVTHCVMEVSSHALAQERVAGIEFAVGIFTNLTGDHLDYHGTMEEYAAAKARLFEGLREGAVAVVNVGDPWAERMLRDCKCRAVSYRVLDGLRKLEKAKRLDLGIVSFGIRKPPYRDLPVGTWEVSIEEMTPGLMTLWIEGKKAHSHLYTTLIGRHNAANAIAVFAASMELAVEPIVIIKRLMIAKGAPGRLQRVEGDADFSVFVDYAHTHDALENVLTALRATMGGGRLICLFGCGGDRDRTKRPKMGAVAERLADVVMVTSDNPRTEEPGAIIEEICAGFSEGWKYAGKIVVEGDRRAAILRAIGMAREGDVVLLAGKGHENYQIIGATKHHFDDVEEAAAAMSERIKHEVH